MLCQGLLSTLSTDCSGEIKYIAMVIVSDINPCFKTVTPFQCIAISY